MVNELKTGFQWTPVDFYSAKQASAFDNEGGRAITLGFGLTSAIERQRAEPAQHAEHQHRGVAQLAARAITASGSAAPTRPSPTRASSGSWRRPPCSASRRPAIRRRACSPRRTSRARRTRQLNDARQLYALLTGRVSAVNATSRLNASTGEYEYLGTLDQRFSQKEFGAYAQDSWRVTPSLTLNYGLRWEVVRPYQAITDTFASATLADLCGVSGIGSGPEGRQCNLFQPGNLAGGDIVPKYTAFDNNEPGFKTEWNNFAPNIGAAWLPRVQDGWLRSIMGDPDTATLRAGYSQSFNRERMDRFTGSYGNNPGGAIEREPERRTTATWCIRVRAGRFCSARPTGSGRRRSARTAPRRAACVPRTPAYPITATVANNLNIIDPDLGARLDEVVDRRFPALAHQGLGDRDPLRRQPELQRLDYRRLERAQHRRERVHRRVQARPGEPARQHRGEPGRDVPLLRRRHRHVAAADVSGVLQRRQPEPGQRCGPLHVDQLRRHGVDRPPQRLQPRSGGRRERPARQRDVPRATRRRRGCR